MLLNFVTSVMRLLTKDLPSPDGPYITHNLADTDTVYVRTCRWLPWLVSKVSGGGTLLGITIARCIIITEDGMPTIDTIIKHEMVHVGQYEELGVFGFLYEYFRRERKYAYRDKPLEKEAFKVAG